MTGLEIFLCVFGGVASAFVMWVAAWATRLQRESMRRERRWVIDAMRQGREMEAERRRYVDWFYRRTGDAPRLREVTGGKVEECAVIPFRKPETI